MEKYLVYEVFPSIGQSQFVAVHASGGFGHMVGVKPESRVYSWYAEGPENAIGMVQAFLNGPLGQQTQGGRRKPNQRQEARRWRPTNAA